MLRAVYRAPAADQVPHGESAVSAIRYRPGRRHVLRYGRADVERVGPVFAKLYAGEDGANIYHRATRIGEWLSRQGNGVNAVRPLAYVQEEGVVLCQGLPGIARSERLQSPNVKLAAY